MGLATVPKGTAYLSPALQPWVRLLCRPKSRRDGIRKPATTVRTGEVPASDAVPAAEVRPEGTAYLSPALQRWVTYHQAPSPAGDDIWVSCRVRRFSPKPASYDVPTGTRNLIDRYPRASPKHVLWIVRRTRFPQQRHELLLETPLAMMLGLTCDVIGYDLLLRLAYAERAVSLLPLEGQTALSQPARAVAFQFLYGFGQRHRRRHVYQEMNVGCRSSGGKQRDVFRMSDPGQVPTHLDSIRYEIATILGAEDAVHEHPSMGVRHVTRLSSRALQLP
jgi:hypothetical protein